MAQETLPPDFSPYSSGDEWLAQYIFGSFYFSQGFADLQSDIDSFAIGVVATDAQRRFIADTPKDTTLALAESAITDYFAKGSNHDLGKKGAVSINTNINERIAKIKTVVNLSNSRVARKILPIIVQGMIGREEKFLGISPKQNDLDYSNGHRAIPGNPRYGTSPLLSHLVDKKEASHPLFNTMFTEMRKLDFDPETLARLQTIEAAIALMQERRPVRDIGAMLLSIKDEVE